MAEIIHANWKKNLFCINSTYSRLDQIIIQYFHDFTSVIMRFDGLELIELI